MLNVVTLIGRLTRDIELKYTPSGKAVASFTLAVDGMKKEDTQFLDCVAWQSSAEYLSQYQGKGKLIAVEGRLQVRTWVAQDGTKRKAVEVVATRVIGLEFKQGEKKEPTSAVGCSEDFDDPFADG